MTIEPRNSASAGIAQLHSDRIVSPTPRVGDLGCVATRGLPEFDGILFGVVQVGEATVGVRLRVDGDVNARGTKLRGHLVEVADAEVDHPHLARVAEVFAGERKRSEGGGAGFLTPSGLIVAGGDDVDAEVGLIPLGERFWIVRAKEKAADAKDALSGKIGSGGRSGGRGLLGAERER